MVLHVACVCGGGYTDVCVCCCVSCSPPNTVLQRAHYLFVTPQCVMHDCLLFPVHPNANTASAAASAAAATGHTAGKRDVHSPGLPRDAAALDTAAVEPSLAALARAASGCAAAAQQQESVTPPAAVIAATGAHASVDAVPQVDTAVGGRGTAASVPLRHERRSSAGGGCCPATDQQQGDAEEALSRLQEVRAGRNKRIYTYIYTHTKSAVTTPLARTSSAGNDVPNSSDYDMLPSLSCPALHHMRSLLQVRPALLNEQSWLRFWVEEHELRPQSSTRSRRSASFNGSGQATTPSGSAPPPTPGVGAPVTPAGGSTGGSNSVATPLLPPGQLVHACRCDTVYASDWFLCLQSLQ